MERKSGKFILLTFDVEEFDMPLNYSQKINTNEQLSIGYKGLTAILECLKQHPHIKCTFFTTVLFAKMYPDLIRNISMTHEIASHTYSNSDFRDGDLKLSKAMLESITLQPVYGLRMPQMQPVSAEAARDCGYSYDSSINPTWIPGRYNNLQLPRKYFVENQLLRIPASVSRHFRIPLFWLAFKVFPYSIFRNMARDVLIKDGYVCLYFHPWEFTDITSYKVPWFIKKDSDKLLLEKLDRLMRDLSDDGEFITMNCISNKIHKGEMR